jgi:hypothetical protein
MLLSLQAASQCHSDPAVAGEDSQINFGSIRPRGKGQRCFAKPALSEAEGLNSPEDESAVADMTALFVR